MDITTQPQKNAKKLYIVKMRETRRTVYRVRAENIEDAEQKAYQKLDDGDDPFDVLSADGDVISCEERNQCQ